jgi:TonB-dependent receptor
MRAKSSADGTRTAILIAAAAAVLHFSAATAEGQDLTGRIAGRVVDARTGAGLADVGIQVVGAVVDSTSSGAMTGVDGRYALPRVSAGTVTLHIRRLGYQAKTVTGVLVTAGAAVEQNVALDAATVQLQTTVVNAAAERGTVSAALDQQRTATGIVNAVTAEQIQRSPDGDAAQAVQRVSGVTVQDGRYVFVRGLGERYTTTSLNGARMPSPEPERKVVPLDLFPAGLIQTITTSKTFTPDQPGDFSGATVDIKTREFPATRQFTYSMSTGLNTAASGRDVLFAPGVGGEWLAMAGAGRHLPSRVRVAGDLTNTSRDERNEIINTFRNVWRANQRSGRPNSAFSASLGGNDPVLGQRIGYLISGTYSYNQEIRADETRALVRPTSDPNVLAEYNRFDGTTGRASALWGGLVNLSTLLGTRTRLSLNNTYSRTADNDARVERGLYEDLGIPLEVQRLDYVERSVVSSQLSGDHTLGRHGLTWSATASRVTRDQPDRSELVYQVTQPQLDTERLLWLNTHSEGAVRTFAQLDENAYEGSANYRLEFGPAARQFVLKTGALARRVDRNADTRSFRITAPIFDEADRALPPELLFDGRFTGAGSRVFELGSLAVGGSYQASDELAAGYAMLDAGLTARLRLIGGARVERSDVRVDAASTLGDPSTAHRTFTDVLPSLAVNFRLTESQNIRIATSRTLARPEYRELAAIRGREVIGGVDVRGNPDLVRTLIDNADVRWEWYPAHGEVLSVGVFAKRFDQPIERVFRASGVAPIVTFVNAESAENYGLELEARKGLGFIASGLDLFTAFTNVTLMRSEINLGASEAAAAGTRENRPMVAQAPYVFNVGLAYASRAGGTSATLLYNRVGERIVYATAIPLPDVKELPRDVLDASLRFPLHRGVSGRVDAKNLLDARYVIGQGSIDREAYRGGRTFTLGLTVRP